VPGEPADGGLSGADVPVPVLPVGPAGGVGAVYAGTSEDPVPNPVSAPDTGLKLVPDAEPVDVLPGTGIPVAPLGAVVGPLGVGGSPMPLPVPVPVAVPVPVPGLVVEPGGKALVVPVPVPPGEERDVVGVGMNSLCFS
jgi:hypothetical protein